MADRLLSDTHVKINAIGRDPRYAHILPFAAAICELRRILLEASSRDDLCAADFYKIAGTLKAIQTGLDAAVETEEAP